MSMSFNQATLAGFVGLVKDERFTPTGKNYSDFTLALNETWTQGEGDTAEKRQRTDWVTVRAWNGLSTIVQKHVKKGRLVLVTGRIRSEKYESDGADKYFTYILADRIVFMDKAPHAEEPPVPDEDIPF